MLKVLQDEVESRVLEIVDLLAKPAGEFAPRVRRVLMELLNTCAAKLSEFENEDTQPRAVMPTRPFTTPPKAPPRPPQETMEITLDQLVGPWSVTTKRDR
jgi:hypothetical protein